MPKINWSYKNTLKNLRNAVRRFNYRIDKELNKNPDAISYLPKKVSVKELRNLIDTRNDYNRELKSLNRISKRCFRTYKKG